MNFRSVEEAFDPKAHENLRAKKRAAWDAVCRTDPVLMELMQAGRGLGMYPEYIEVDGEVVFGQLIERKPGVPAETILMYYKRDHVTRVRGMRCVVSSRPDGIELHHCHGGSISRAGIRRGLGQRTSDWLVIPLHWEYHTGQYDPEAIGIDKWEMLFGEQVEHLRTVSRFVGYDVLERAKMEEEQDAT